MIARMLRRLLPGLVLALLPLPGRAAVLEVAPVTVELSGGTAAAALSVLSHDTAPVYVQVRGFAWTQSGNTDTLTPTDDLILAPPIFSLPGGTPQIVRLVLQRPAGQSERAYRLLIDQIPTHAAGTGVQFAIRLSLPIFVEPLSWVAPAIAARIEAAPGGSAVLVVDNKGTRRTRLLDLALHTAGGLALKLSAPPNPYILAGAERRWTILGPPSLLASGTIVHMTAKTDTGPLDAHVAVTS